MFTLNADFLIAQTVTQEPFVPPVYYSTPFQLMNIRPSLTYQWPRAQTSSSHFHKASHNLTKGPSRVRLCPQVNRKDTWKILNITSGLALPCMKCTAHPALQTLHPFTHIQRAFWRLPFQSKVNIYPWPDLTWPVLHNCTVSFCIFGPYSAILLETAPSHGRRLKAHP